MLLQLDLYLFRFLNGFLFAYKTRCSLIDSEGIWFKKEVSFKKDSSELHGSKSKSVQIVFTLDAD